MGLGQWGVQFRMGCEKWTICLGLRPKPSLSHKGFHNAEAKTRKSAYFRKVLNMNETKESLNGKCLCTSQGNNALHTAICRSCACIFTTTTSRFAAEHHIHRSSSWILVRGRRSTSLMELFQGFKSSIQRFRSSTTNSINNLTITPSLNEINQNRKETALWNRYETQMEVRNNSPESSRPARIGTNSMRFPSIRAPVICFHWLFLWVLAYVVVVWCCICRICWRIFLFVIFSFLCSENNWMDDGKKCLSLSLSNWCVRSDFTRFWFCLKFQWN